MVKYSYSGCHVVSLNRPLGEYLITGIGKCHQWKMSSTNRSTLDTTTTPEYVQGTLRLPFHCGSHQPHFTGTKTRSHDAAACSQEGAEGSPLKRRHRGLERWLRA